MSNNEPKIRAYCIKHSVDQIDLLDKILNVINYVHAKRVALLTNKDSRTVQETLEAFFGDEVKAVILAPLDANRDSIKQYVADTGISFEKVAKNILLNTNGILFHVHRCLTLKFFLENTMSISDSEKLKDSEAMSAEIILRAMDIYFNHREWVGEAKDFTSNLAILLNRLVIAGSDHGVDIEGKFGWEVLSNLTDYNAHLFNLLALAVVNKY